MRDTTQYFGLHKPNYKNKASSALDVELSNLNQENLISRLPFPVLIIISNFLLSSNCNWRDVVSFMLVNKRTYKLLDHPYLPDVFIYIRSGDTLGVFPFNEVKNILVANYFLEKKSVRLINLFNRLQLEYEEIDQSEQSCHRTKMRCCLTLYYSALAVPALLTSLGFAAAIPFLYMACTKAIPCNVCASCSTPCLIAGDVGVSLIPGIIAYRLMLKCCPGPCDQAYSLHAKKSNELMQVEHEIQNYNHIKETYDILQLSNLTENSFFSANKRLGEARAKAREARDKARKKFISPESINAEECSIPLRQHMWE